MTHADLVEKAVRWLRRQGCRVILHDPFRTPLAEQPDAIGWRDGVSIVVEAKTSLADFRVDAEKAWRKNPALGMGDWRFFIAPTGLLSTASLPEGWGLIEAANSVRIVAGGPRGNDWWRGIPFTPNKRQETRLLVSALAQPEARPRPPAMPRRGIAVDSWLNQFAISEQPHDDP
jgi:hypothetical protein